MTTATIEEKRHISELESHELNGKIDALIAELEAKYGTTPNAETIAAIKELAEGGGTRHSSAEELFKDLGI